jgi:hypothetical protein
MQKKNENRKTKLFKVKVLSKLHFKSAFFDQQFKEIKSLTEFERIKNLSNHNRENFPNILSFCIHHFLAKKEYFFFLRNSLTL